MIKKIQILNIILILISSISFANTYESSKEEMVIKESKNNTEVKSINNNLNNEITSKFDFAYTSNSGYGMKYSDFNLDFTYLFYVTPHMSIGPEINIESEKLYSYSSIKTTWTLGPKISFNFLDINTETFVPYVSGLISYGSQTKEGYKSRTVMLLPKVEVGFRVRVLGNALVVISPYYKRQYYSDLKTFNTFGVSGGFGIVF
jgi:hypothetical protein